jgi:hypothetical protein
LTSKDHEEFKKKLKNEVIKLETDIGFSLQDSEGKKLNNNFKERRMNK